MIKKIDYVKQGKRNRAAGQRFEKKVREDLIKKGWIVSKWQNNVKEGKLVSAKPGRFRMMQTGFPDFIIFKIRKGYSYCNEEGNVINEKLHTTTDRIVIGVEVKSGKYLDKIEKEKARWLLLNKVFGQILIASKNKIERGKIIYNEFK